MGSIGNFGIDSVLAGENRTKRGHCVESDSSRASSFHHRVLAYFGLGKQVE
jgi:hypothetical protein